MVAQELISEAATDAIQTIMALGHNKGWEEAASALSVGSLFHTRALSLTPSSLRCASVRTFPFPFHSFCCKHMWSCPRKWQGSFDSWLGSRKRWRPTGRQAFVKVCFELCVRLGHVAGCGVPQLLPAPFHFSVPMNMWGV